MREPQPLANVRSGESPTLWRRIGAGDAPRTPAPPPRPPTPR